MEMLDVGSQPIQDYPEFVDLVLDVRKIASPALQFHELTRRVTGRFVEHGADESEMEGLMWRIWRGVIKFAEIHHHLNQNCWLVTLLQEFRKQSPLTRGNGEVCKVWDLRVWTDLPVFGPAVREAFNQEPTTVAARRHRVNLNAFLARLTTVREADAGDETAEPFDFAPYGIWAMREALEDEDDLSRVPVWKIAVAHMWLRYAGHLMQRLSGENRQYGGNLCRAGRVFQDKQWFGYSEDRWETWWARLPRMSEEELDQLQRT